MDQFSRRAYDVTFERDFLKKKGNAFQDFFVQIMEKAYPGDFIPTKPWGNTGDKKNDGYLSSARTLFQVYAPDEIMAAATLRKIDEDFQGALEHWSEHFDRWVFVHNSEGLAPQVVEKLLKLGQEHPEVKIEHWGLEKLRQEFWKVPEQEIITWFGPLLATIGGGASPLEQVPLCPNYVPRLEELERIKHEIMAAKAEHLPAALHGMAGVGKTMLAAAMACDPSVGEAFPQGVFWLSLGPKPNLTVRQTDLARMLGAQEPGFSDIEQGKDRLRSLTSNRVCLLILDDVYHPHHAAAFLLGGSCTVFLTTRDEAVIQGLNARPMPLEAFSDELAAEFIAKATGTAAGQVPDIAKQVARGCGNLPLALAMLVARFSKQERGWEIVRERLKQADLDRVSRALGHYVHPGLLQALQVSVDALEDERLKTRYIDFAVFREDFPVPQSALTTLWALEGVNELDAQEMVNRLLELCLLSRTEHGRLTLNPIQRKYVQHLAGAGIPSLHERLIKAYQRRFPGGWETLTDDGFFPHELFYHLEQSGQTEEMHRLLALDRNQSSIPWLELARRLKQFTIFQDAVDRTLRHTQSDIGRSAYYSLIRSSLNSLGEGLSPSLPALLVDAGLWTVDEAKEQIRSMAAPEAQIEAATGLVKLKPPVEARYMDVLYAMIWAVRGLPVSGWRNLAEAMALLPPGYLDEAVGFINFIPRPDCRLLAVVRLLPSYQPEKALEVSTRALDLLRSIPPTDRGALGKSYKEQNHFSAHSTQGNEEDAFRMVECEILGGLVPYLPEEEAAKARREAYARADAITHVEPRMEALTWLLPIMPPEFRSQRFKEIFSARSAINYELLVSKFIVAALAPAPPPDRELLSAAMEWTNELSDYWRARTQIGLAGLNVRPPSDSDFLDWLRIARGTQDERSKAGLLSDCPFLLPEQSLPEFLDATSGISDPAAWNALLPEPSCMAFIMMRVSWREQLQRQAASHAKLTPNKSLPWMQLLLTSEVVPEPARRRFLAEDRSFVRNLQQNRWSDIAILALRLEREPKQEIARKLLAELDSKNDAVEQVAFRATLAGFLPDSLRNIELEAIKRALDATEPDWLRAWLSARLCVGLTMEEGRPYMQDALGLVNTGPHPYLFAGPEVARWAPEPERRAFLRALASQLLAQFEPRADRQDFLHGPMVRCLARAASMIGGEEGAAMGTRAMRETANMHKGEGIMVWSCLGHLLEWTDERIEAWTNVCLELAIPEGFVGLMALFPEISVETRLRFTSRLRAGFPRIPCEHCRKVLGTAVMLFDDGALDPQLMDDVCQIREDALFVKATTQMATRAEALSPESVRLILPALFENLATRPRGVVLAVFMGWVRIFQRIGGSDLLVQLHAATQRVTAIWK